MSGNRFTRAAHRRPAARRLACVALALCTVLGGATAAGANELDVDPNGGGASADPTPHGGAAVVNCDDEYWPVPLTTVFVHTTWFNGTSAEKDDMLDAVADVAKQINTVGGSSASVSPVIVETSAPFGLNTRDAAQTIHLGFVPSLDDGAKGATNPIEWEHDCRQIQTANIAMLDQNFDWNYGTPNYGNPREGVASYYQAERADDSGNWYFRGKFLHELLHSFGLDHKGQDYSFMNYGNLPWANESADNAIRPLPADVRELRRLYPMATSRSEVSVLNTWYDPEPVGDDPADQQLLCAPSRGASREADLFDDHCGTGGVEDESTVVCPGDTLHTRFTLANYSTEDVDVTARLWFSTDHTWNSTDKVSPTVLSFSEGDASSTQRGGSWTVPTLPANTLSRLSPTNPGVPGTSLDDYYVIARVQATTTSGVTVTDWIPLRGQVQSTARCGTPTEPRAH